MKPRLLVVDDNRLILGSLTALLEVEDFEVEAVCSATQAAIALKRRAFDLVITDMNMETPTAGYDVARAAREQPYQPEIVILTALPLPTAEWKKQGVKAVFLKGGQTPSTLIASIREIVENSDSRERAEGSTTRSLLLGGHAPLKPHG